MEEDEDQFTEKEKENFDKFLRFALDHVDYIYFIIIALLLISVLVMNNDLKYCQEVGNLLYNHTMNNCVNSLLPVLP